MNQARENRSYILAAAAVIIVFCTYQFVLTPDQRNSLNKTLSDVSRQAPKSTIATLAALPTSSIVVPTVPAKVSPRTAVPSSGGGGKPATAAGTVASPVPSPTPMPLCSQTADQANCTPDPTAVIVATDPPVEVPAIDVETGQGNNALIATATAEVAQATAAPEFVKPSVAQTCQFIGCLPNSQLGQTAKYQAECHAMYWQYDGKLPPADPDRTKVTTCIATGDYR